jgi:hypothetical protein
MILNSFKKSTTHYLYFEGRELEVRKNSVCHGVNGYVGIIDELVNGTLISIPQKPFEEMLNIQMVFRLEGNFKFIKPL